MGFHNITLKDIAKALNLSVSAVSKALRDSHEISSKTKKDVLEYARKHNYKPDPIAQRLKGGKSRILAVFVPAIDNNFFSQVIDGIESIAYAKGYSIIIIQTHESLEKELLSVQNLDLRSVGGLLVSVTTETREIDHFKALAEQGFPIVFFDRVPKDILTHKIQANNFKGAYEGTVHLIKAGFNRIAHITSCANISITTERLMGYRKALEDHAVPYRDEYVKFCEHGGRDTQEIEHAFRELINLPEKPDAIFAASDRITVHGLIILNKMGIKIPSEMGFMGFTNIILADALNPPITSIYQPAALMGNKAVEKLIEIIESKNRETDYETIVFDTELQIRNSTKKPAAINTIKL